MLSTKHPLLVLFLFLFFFPKIKFRWNSEKVSGWYYPKCHHGPLGLCIKLTWKVNHSNSNWESLTVADPGFPVGGAPTSDTYTFRQKHMRKWKKLILLGGWVHAGSVPLDPPMVNTSNGNSWHYFWFINYLLVSKFREIDIYNKNGTAVRRVAIHLNKNPVESK